MISQLFIVFALVIVTSLGDNLANPRIPAAAKHCASFSPGSSELFRTAVHVGKEAAIRIATPLMLKSLLDGPCRLLRREREPVYRFAQGIVSFKQAAEVGLKPLPQPLWHTPERSSWVIKLISSAICSHSDSVRGSRAFRSFNGSRQASGKSMPQRQENGQDTTEAGFSWDSQSSTAVLLMAICEGANGAVCEAMPANTGALPSQMLDAVVGRFPGTATVRRTIDEVRRTSNKLLNTAKAAKREMQDAWRRLW